MTAPRSSVNLSKLRLKLFGPTLDDSVLYGVDRLMDLCTVASADEIDSRHDSATEEISYQSCESLPCGTAVPGTPHPLSKLTVSKLSSQEMEYIRDAIAEAGRKSHRRMAREEHPDARKALPELVRSRWTMARVHEFDDGSQTYEIMNSTDELLLRPRAELADTEIVFAMLKNGSTGAFRAGCARPTS